MTDPFRILYLCTGNSCRSPMGEALLRKRLEEKNLSDAVEVLSAGTFAVENQPPSPEAEQSVKKYGASLDGFRSQMLTAELAQRVHLILVMEYAHLDTIQEIFPEADDKVRLVGHYLYPNGPEEIPDPVGGPQDLFDEVAGLIDESIHVLLRDWENTRKRYYQPRKKVIATAFDHRGFPQKEWLLEKLDSMGYTVLDCGTHSDKSCDHPDYAFLAAEKVSCRQADRAVLVCATGHGMLIAANKVWNARAVMPVNEEHAILSRTHNNANVLTFGADFHNREFMEQIMRAWIETPFWGGKYHRRVRKITHYEHYNRY